jgi:hypothetical protein
MMLPPGGECKEAGRGSGSVWLFPAPTPGHKYPGYSGNEKPAEADSKRGRRD